MLHLCVFFNDTATTEIYTYGHTLSLHDALPILSAVTDAHAAFQQRHRAVVKHVAHQSVALVHAQLGAVGGGDARRVLAAVLQHGQSVVQRCRDFSGSDDADDAAHGGSAVCWRESGAAGRTGNVGSGMRAHQSVADAEPGAEAIVELPCLGPRTEARRVGKEGVITCKYWGHR